MTRELKLALIVGFALVLVVTVLISDHLSHARQTRLATLPSDPAKVTEPPPIALENGADTLPPSTVTEPVANAPAPLIGSMPTTDAEPLVLVQGNPTRVAGALDLINPNPQSTTPAPMMTDAPFPAAPQQSQPSQPFAASSGGLEDVVRNVGGRIEGNTILVPGVQTHREQLAAGATQPTPTPTPAPTGVTPLARTPQATLPVPASTDRVHAVASGENLFKICTRYYNDGKVWRKLAKYNGIDASKPLRIGQQLKVPAADVLLGRPAANPALANADAARGVTAIPSGRAPVVEPGSTAVPRPLASTPTATPKTRPYTIKKGDSLAAIAQRELGTIRRAREIVELNKKIIKNPDNVPLGATIQLPAA